MAEKRVPLLLPEDLYRRLAERAVAKDREPSQEARAILRAVLQARS